MFEGGARDAGRTVVELRLVLLAGRPVLRGASHSAGVRHGCEVLNTEPASLLSAL